MKFQGTLKHCKVSVVMREHGWLSAFSIGSVIQQHSTAPVPAEAIDSLNIVANEEVTPAEVPLVTYVLTDEEALYLHQKELLEIHFRNGECEATGSTPPALDVQQLWQCFTSNNRSFPQHYSVYKYFRDRGFIVKTGVNFGATFAVYRTVPGACHSEACALVLGGSGAGFKDTISWLQLGCVLRTMQDVGKMLFLCYTSYPPGVVTGSLDESTPACLLQLTVRVVVAATRRHPGRPDLSPALPDIQKKIREQSLTKRVQSLTAAPSLNSRLSFAPSSLPPLVEDLLLTSDDQERIHIEELEQEQDPIDGEGEDDGDVDATDLDHREFMEVDIEATEESRGAEIEPISSTKPAAAPTTIEFTTEPASEPPADTAPLQLKSVGMKRRRDPVDVRRKTTTRYSGYWAKLRSLCEDPLPSSENATK